MKVLVLFIISLFFISCSSYKVKRDYDESYNFKKIKTYYILNNEATKFKSNSILGKRAINALEKQLDQRSLIPSSKSEADIHILLEYIEKEYIQQPRNSLGVGFGRRTGFGFGGVSVGRSFGQSTIKELDSLKLIFIDRKSKMEIWKVEAQGDFKSEDPEKSKEYFKKALDEMFEKYPSN